MGFIKKTRHREFPIIVDLFGKLLSHGYPLFHTSLGSVMLYLDRVEIKFSCIDQGMIKLFVVYHKKNANYYSATVRKQKKNKVIKKRLWNLPLGFNNSKHPVLYFEIDCYTALKLNSFIVLPHQS